MNNNKLKKYIFIENLNDKIERNIKRFNNIKIIFYSKNIDRTTIQECIKIRNFCSKNKIQFYIIDNYKLAIKIKAFGIFISSQNKRINLCPSLFTKLHIMGSAHNQLEYYFKKMQLCKIVALSPLFFNPKYSKNKILNPIKFNLITKNWNVEKCALGGITKNNMKKILLTNATSLAFRSFIMN